VKDHSVEVKVGWWKRIIEEVGRAGRDAVR